MKLLRTKQERAQVADQFMLELEDALEFLDIRAPGEEFEVPKVSRDALVYWAQEHRPKWTEAELSMVGQYMRLLDEYGGTEALTTALTSIFETGVAIMLTGTQYNRETEYARRSPGVELTAYMAISGRGIRRGKARVDQAALQGVLMNESRRLAGAIAGALNQEMRRGRRG